MNQNLSGGREKHGKRYLSSVGAWALAFGCSVGWGAFVMPGTTFLPAAGPLGTAIGIMIGAALMLIIGMNYSYLMRRFPKAGGTLNYSIETFGYDHGFLSSWFLMLVYIAIIWANASALALISRYLLGDFFHWGFRYTILGYEVWLGEAVLSIATIVFCGFICMRLKRMAIHLQTVLAVILFGGILLSAFFVFRAHFSGFETLEPAYAESGKNAVRQIIGIVVLSPWAFVGFESISHSVEEFRFSACRTIWIMAAALAAGAMSYIALTEIAALVQPAGTENWVEYIAHLALYSDLRGLPTFHAMQQTLGRGGLLLLGVTVVSAIGTGIIGNMIAASRLLDAMAEERILPEWFGKKSEDGTPVNAVLFLILLSLPIPFLGRTAIGWIVDVTTIGATIAYGYTSASAFVEGRREQKKFPQITGILGFGIAVVFFLYFMAFSADAMATESYLILVIWSILGFVYFRHMFDKDKTRRFGRSTVVWVGLLFLIFFTSVVWVKQATNDMTSEVLSNTQSYYEMAPETREASHDHMSADAFVASQIARADRFYNRNGMIQIVIIISGLLIMISMYTIVARREKEMEIEKAKAEESSKAKTVFLSNMSHDIRTPMNAIIGYTNLAEQEENHEEELREYLSKIKASSLHLLALINDVLEMSRIENGKMDLECVPVDLNRVFTDVRDMFETQMTEKKIEFTVDTSGIRDNHVYSDRNRLNRVLLNLLSNAYKFTAGGGAVQVTAKQIGKTDNVGHYEIRVKDNGVGMSQEFAERVFEAFEREKTSTISGIQGTGLGMAITKSIIDLMNGTIEVHTAPDQGTEFIISLDFEIQEKPETAEINGAFVEHSAMMPEGVHKEPDAEEKTVDFTTKRLLLVEDIMVNREIATMILGNLGFTVEVAENGKEAVEKVADSEEGYYDCVLMDIQMPVMDGYEATRAIRQLPMEELSSVPIVAMTANAFTEDVQKAREAGMNGHIAKPIDIDNLVKTLTEVLS